MSLDSIDGAEVIAYDTRNLEFPEDGAVDAAIVTGSIDSVNDDLEYVHAARRWVRSATVPMFGVCFGHQLIGMAFGGEVARMPERELGYRRITLDRPEDPLFEGISERPMVFLCHEETVVEPPPDATVVASNDRGIQAFRRGRTVSVQFHPEASEEHARRLLTELELPATARKNALATVTEENAESARRPRRVFENFIDGLDGEREAC